MYWLFIIFSVIVIMSIFQRNTIESFSSRSYRRCRHKGYTKQFCLQTPFTNMNTDTCMCENGNVGRRLPGFRGKCICTD